jgi:hypothetical protein
MESTRFDRLTRLLATANSRREVLKTLAGATAAVGAGVVIAPASRAQTCGDPGDDCATDEDCCQGFYCNFDGICAGAAECADIGGGCDADAVCCGDAVCSEADRVCVAAASDDAECADDGDCDGEAICCGGVCAEIACCTDDADPNARCPEGTSCFEGYCDPIGSQTDGATDLPATGVGGADGGTSDWLLGVASLGGIAAAGAAWLGRSNPAVTPGEDTGDSAS